MGWCPVCEQNTEFRAEDNWFRDSLLCANCGSLPRERAFQWALQTFCPNWRTLVVHESSPSTRQVSQRLRDQCPGYVGSHFSDDTPRGEMKDGFRSEDLESMTFADASIDVHCHLDVLEHVNRPNQCFQEMSRTMTENGMAVFTTPIYTQPTSVRKAIYFEDGVEHLDTPEYHGNPIDPNGALVTFHYGQDLSALIRTWTPDLGVNRIDINDERLGIVGEFRDVWVVSKRPIS